MAAPSVCVVGSINLDMNAYVHRFPRPGETLHGGRFTTGYGGKGANQAVMVARLGGAISMVGRVGDDIFGQDMRRNLAAEGIDARFVFESAGVSSGVAVITVDDNGQNNIIVIAGANGLVTPDDVAAAQPAIAGARVLLCQMEVPMAANLAALRLARAAGVITIFNSAPVSGDVPDRSLPTHRYLLSQRDRGRTADRHRGAHAGRCAAGCVDHPGSRGACGVDHAGRARLSVCVGRRCGRGHPDGGSERGGYDRRRRCFCGQPGVFPRRRRRRYARPLSGRTPLPPSACSPRGRRRAIRGEQQLPAELLAI